MRELYIKSALNWAFLDTQKCRENDLDPTENKGGRDLQIESVSKVAKVEESHSIVERAQKRLENGHASKSLPTWTQNIYTYI